MVKAKFLGWAIGRGSKDKDVLVPVYEMDGQHVFALDGKLIRAYPAAVGVEALMAEAAKTYGLSNVKWRPFLVATDDS